jgi:hypothetical protein
MAVGSSSALSPLASRTLRLVLSGLLLWLALALAFHAVRGDDAFITYRYGQNLARGEGLVFSHGERVQGFTSPGHALLSALVYVVSGRQATPGVMAVLGCGAWSVEVIALFALLETALGTLVAAYVALLIGVGVAAGAAWVVLETHFVAAAVLTAFALARRERWSLAAISCGVAVLFRPDALLAAGLVLGACAWRQRVRAIGPCALFVLVAAPWPLFASAYYGAPVPQTALTKFHRVALLPYVMHELGYPSRRLLWADASVVFSGLAFALAVYGAVKLWRHGLWIVPVYGVLHAAAYAELRPFVQHTWHLYPWSLVFCVCVALALAPPSAASSRRRTLQTLLPVALTVLALVRFGDESQRLARGYWTGQRDAVYQRIADYLREHSAPDEAFASVEVGTIGYYSDRPAFDLGGLVTPPGEPMAKHDVRYLIVDKGYPQLKPPRAPSFAAREGEFAADVYELRSPRATEGQALADPPQ